MSQTLQKIILRLLLAPGHCLRSHLIKKVFYKFALNDPDAVIYSSARSSTSYYRVEDNFKRDQTINSIFLEACDSVFCHLSIAEERGLKSTTAETETPERIDL